MKLAFVIVVACGKAAPEATPGSGSAPAIAAVEIAVPAPSDRAVAGLDLETSEAVVVKLLGAPTSKSPIAPDEDLHQPTSTWTWAARAGLTVKLARNQVLEVTLAAPSLLATTKGIHVGSTRAEVLAAYGKPDSDNPMGKGLEIIAYGGVADALIIDLEAGKVTTIARSPLTD